MSFAYMLVTIYGDDEEEAWKNKDKIVNWMLEGEEQGTMPDEYSSESEAHLLDIKNRIDRKVSKTVTYVPVLYRKDEEIGYVPDSPSLEDDSYYGTLIDIQNHELGGR